MIEPVLYQKLSAIAKKLKIAVPTSDEPMTSSVWVRFFDQVSRKIT